MNTMQVVFLVLLAIVAVCSGECNTSTFKGGEFNRCMKLNEEYDFYWRIEGVDVVIALHLRNYVNPWVALGISVNGGMKGGDIAVARFENGKYVLEDRFATKFQMPMLDTLQNVKLISASSDATTKETIVVYSRPLESCDVDQDQPILANATQVIYAYGEGAFGFHNLNRGTVFVHFHYEKEELPLPADYSVVNVTMDNYPLPEGQVTTYTCISAVLPSETKYHIVRWRPIITNPENVHHIVLFGCYADAKTPDPYECPMAPSTALCANVVVVWTVGQHGDDFLGEFALPMGKGVATGIYIVMQMHYNNPSMQSGIVDSSGIEIFYTPELRKYDVGTVPMSTPWQGGFLKLPPGEKENYRYTRCHSECTTKSLPAEGVTMINWFPHMHELGSKIWITHIRDGVELPEIHRDDYYDFARQQNFPVNRRILPGDSLMMNCIWDTSNKKEWTYGGEETNDEMCIGIFQYYPAAVPPTWTRCTDLHEYLNTTGTDASWATCNKNDIPSIINPFTNKTFGNVTAVVANAPYTHLPPRISTCAIEEPTASPPVTTTTGAFDENSSSIVFICWMFVICSVFISTL